jgi:hypothetical protein
LWPRKAEGRPVRMRIAPSTPKAGSMRVSRVMGAGVAEADAEAVVDAVVEVEEGTRVEVTLNTVGRAVVETGMDWVPEREKAVDWTTEDCAKTETVGEGVGELAGLDAGCWASTWAARRRGPASTAKGRWARMMVGGRGVKSSDGLY